MGVVYGNNSMELADEKQKLAQLLFHRWVKTTHTQSKLVCRVFNNSDSYELALKRAQEALQLLHVYKGEHDQDVQDLEQMETLLSSMQKP